MPKVSIVMPAYNVEKYFCQCIESVINQTLEDIEIIPVDDGSPDNCGKIMDEYAAKDPRVKPIHQENGGYGKAVNAGINAATGEYIGIVETDDWAEPEMFEKLYTQAKKFDADLCKCDFKYYYGNNHFKPCHNIEKIASENEVFTIKEKPELFNYHVSIWSGIYKKEYLDKNNIRVMESKSASYQDMPFMVEVLAKGAKITLVHDHLLNYRTEEGMNSSTIRSDGRLKIMPIMCQEAMRCFKENGCWDEVKEVAYRHFFNCSVGMFFQTDKEFTKAHFEELYKLFKDVDADKIEYKYFKKKDIKVIDLIKKNSYDGVMNIHKRKAFGRLRKKFISIKWNKFQKSITFLGKELFNKKN